MVTLPPMEYMVKLFLIIGALCAFLGVSAGAFGAHYLKGKIDPHHLEYFEVGVRYQMYHSLALMVVALTLFFASNFFVSTAAWLLLAGMAVFSGSLYMLAFTGITLWGAVTPIGGALLLLGWIFYTIGVFKA